MRDPLDALASALERDIGGIAIVWSPPDVGARDWLVSEVERLAVERLPAIVHTVEDALAIPDRLALLVPQDEREVVLDLDASRDRIFSEEAPRSQPIVLFLFRSGEGQNSLAHAASLRGLSRGSDPDPTALADAPALVDSEEERAAFSARTNKSPEAWLKEWSSEEHPRTAENYTLAIWADFLVQS